MTRAGKSSALTMVLAVILADEKQGGDREEEEEGNGGFSWRSMSQDGVKGITPMVRLTPQSTYSPQEEIEHTG